jgi:hypothetical protein
MIKLDESEQVQKVSDTGGHTYRGTQHHDGRTKRTERKRQHRGKQANYIQQNAREIKHTDIDNEGIGWNEISAVAWPWSTAKT